MHLWTGPLYACRARLVPLAKSCELDFFSSFSKVSMVGSVHVQTSKQFKPYAAGLYVIALHLCMILQQALTSKA